MTSYRALAALAFVVAYLLYPPMQASLAAEFHAMPLATPLILLAFLFSERQQWGRFALAALSVALVQEGAALLTAMLGLYAFARGLQLRRYSPLHPPHSASSTPHSPLRTPRRRPRHPRRPGLVLRRNLRHRSRLRRPSLRSRRHTVRRTLWRAGRWLWRRGALAADPPRSRAARGIGATASSIHAQATGAGWLPGPGRTRDPTARPAAAPGQPAERLSVPIQRPASLFGAPGGVCRFRRHRRQPADPPAD